MLSFSNISNISDKKDSLTTSLNMAAEVTAQPMKKGRAVYFILFIIDRTSL